MIVTLTSVARPDAGPATDLGFLLHKHPERVHVTRTAHGRAYVFYPQADARTCSAALVLDVDPVALVQSARGRRDVPDSFALGQYVNDRPYAASSLLAVALGKVFGTAMAGRCTARPDLVDVPLHLAVHVPALPARGGTELVRRLFEPLGWGVEARDVPLDETRPEWGPSRYVDLRLRGELRLADALTHLYVLIPVLDDTKHYWVGQDEVDKLLRAGERWLPTHPERDLITQRYLTHRRPLVRTAIDRLAEVDDLAPETLDNAVPEPDDARPVRLAVVRRDAVLAVLRACGARRVLDLGCGDGVLLDALLADPSFTEVVGVDVSPRALEIAARRLRLDRLPERARERVRLLQSSLTYTDARLAGYDAAVLMEVIEHLDPARLPALEHAVLGAARPATVVVTTPNAEYNVRYPGLAGGGHRHPDHRFEWSRAEFRGWAERVAAGHGYAVRFEPVGDDDPDVGPPTQLAVLTRTAGEDR